MRRLIILGIFVCTPWSVTAQYLFQQVLTPDSTASSNSEPDVDPHLAFSDGNWVAVWSRTDGPISGGDDFATPGVGLNDELFFARSLDHGLTWTPTARLKHPFTTYGDDVEPRIGSNDSGAFIVVWRSKDNLGGTIGSDTDILFARTDDGGSSWSTPAALSTLARTDSTDDYTPSIASNGGSVWIAAWVRFTGINNVQVARSLDNGRTWQTPLNIASTGSGGGPLPLYLGDHRWLLTWHSGPLDGEDVYYALSEDDGATWSERKLLHPTMISDNLRDVECQTATDQLGNIVAVFDSGNRSGLRNYPGRYSVSNDFGQTWSLPRLYAPGVSDANWITKRPQISTNRNGRWVIVWPSLGGLRDVNNQLLMVESLTNGISWSDPMPLASQTELSPADAVTYFRSIGIENDRYNHWMVISSNKNGLGGTLGADADILVARAQLEARPLVIGAFDESRAPVYPQSGNWNLPTGGVYAALRSLLLNPTNFGFDGKIKRLVSIQSTPALTADYLRSISIFILTPATALTLEEQLLLEAYVREGGAVLSSHQMANRKFFGAAATGQSTQSHFDVAVPDAPPATGPFGQITQVNAGGSFVLAPPPGTNVFASSDGGPAIILGSPETGSPGLGRFLMIADEEALMGGTFPGEAVGALSTLSNQIFFLNAIAWLAGAPGIDPSALHGSPYFRPAWYYSPGTGHSYRLVDGLDYTSLRQRALEADGSLVSIGDAVENQWLLATFSQELPQIASAAYFTGLFRQIAANPFAWINGDGSPYRNWAAGHPTSDSLASLLTVSMPPAAEGEWISSGTIGFPGIMELPHQFPVILLAPRGDVDLKPDQRVWVHWLTDLNKAGSSIAFELWREGHFVRTLASGWASDGEGDGWLNVPLDIPRGSGYRLRAVSLWNPNLYDPGANNITLLRPENNAARDWTFYR